MLILKYSRTETAAFIPHLDVLRHFGRTLKRAGLKIKYSEGFHPHMLFWFGNPIGLGIPTLSEYCAVDSPENPEEFLERFNEKSVPGIKILLAKSVTENPNFADVLRAAEYEISLQGIDKRVEEIKEISSDPNFSVSYGNGRTKTATDKILSLEADADCLRVRLKSGKENLKADMWMSAVLEKLGIKEEFSLIRTRQFALNNGILTDADEMFFTERL